MRLGKNNYSFYLYFFGFVVIGLLVVRTHMTSEVSEQLLKETVRQQESLRNVLWINLLTQRAAVLTLAGSSNSSKQAQRIADALPIYLQTNTATAGDEITNKVESIFAQIKVINENPAAHSDLKNQMLAAVEKLGIGFNAEESKRWFDLLAKNNRMQQDIRNRRLQNDIGAAFFMLFFAFLGWVLLKKRQTEALLRQSEVEKQMAEKANLAKSTFLANMSHELRTPMHGILSFARFGQQKISTASQEKLKSYFDEIYESGARLMTLLNDLLDLSKLEAGRFEYAFRENDLTDVGAAIVSEMKAFAEEKHVGLEMHCASASIKGVFDNERMMQVTRNLVSNAIKFSKEGTIIRLELEESESMLKCRVINVGIGIPAVELESIFDKFVQSSKTRTGAGGTGLGLAICKEIVLQHHGKIWAESQLDGETRFTFELPKRFSAADLAA